jgi:hypothetical protein
MHIKGTVSGDFLLVVFFMNQLPPSPRVSHYDRFEFFRTFAEIFASQGAPPHRHQRTGGKFATGVNDTCGSPLSCEYLRQFSKKFETALMVYSGAWEKLINEKTRSRKSRDTLSLSLIYNTRERVATWLLKSIPFPFFLTGTSSKLKLPNAQPMHLPCSQCIYKKQKVPIPGFHKENGIF